mmetsp:Transcript_44428/g.93270  ORF Transcript_44428/g.93270 Transcript_44428/m.93270 type:complete len:459 (-) Transcript_44428:48-1424(-)
MEKRIISTLALAAVCATNVIYCRKHMPTDEAKAIVEAADETLPPSLRSADHDQRRLLEIELQQYIHPETVTSKTTNPQTAGETKTRTNRPKAVLHIGPPKTGTTALQSSIREGAESLIEDGYTMPWYIRNPDQVNELAFATCFESKVWEKLALDESELCPKGELSLITRLGEEGKNIFLSSEFFSFVTDIDDLANFLEPWDVTIIYFHRWYYDWHFSQYNQSLKSRLEKKLRNFDEFVAARGGGGDVYVLAFDAYFGRAYRRDFSDELEAYRSVYQYRQHFDDVVTLDYEDGNISVTENLFCNGMKDATNTCEHFLRQKGKSNALNRATTMAYKNIAYGANQLALASFCSREQFDDVVDKIQYHQEKALGFTSSDFPMKCIEDEILDKMLEVSVEHRRQILLDDPFTEEEEARARELYWENIKHKACDPDIDLILEMPEWLEFFETLEKGSSCHLSKE